MESIWVPELRDQGAVRKKCERGLPEGELWVQGWVALLAVMGLTSARVDGEINRPLAYLMGSQDSHTYPQPLVSEPSPQLWRETSGHWPICLAAGPQLEGSVSQRPWFLHHLAISRSLQSQERMSSAFSLALRVSGSFIEKVMLSVLFITVT